VAVCGTPVARHRLRTSPADRRSLERMADHERDRPAAETGSGVGRAVARYTAMRFLLFVVCFLVARLLIDELVLALGAAVLASAVLSIPLLRDQRQQVSAATAARAAQRAGRTDQERPDDDTDRAER
jgi:Flp pilus assembly protein TadB